MVKELSSLSYSMLYKCFNAVDNDFALKSGDIDAVAKYWWSLKYF